MATAPSSFEPTAFVATDTYEVGEQSSLWQDTWRRLRRNKLAMFGVVFMGLVAGFKAFTGAVLGGIGSVVGAMLGGYLLGGLEVLGTAIFPAEWKDVFAFIALILLLTVRPTGIVRDASASARV